MYLILLFKSLKIDASYISINDFASDSSIFMRWILLWTILLGVCSIDMLWWKCNQSVTIYNYHLHLTFLWFTEVSIIMRNNNDWVINVDFQQCTTWNDSVTNLIHNSIYGWINSKYQAENIDWNCFNRWFPFQAFSLFTPYIHVVLLIKMDTTCYGWYIFKTSL